jgi:hypothetical protein
VSTIGPPMSPMRLGPQPSRQATGAVLMADWVPPDKYDGKLVLPAAPAPASPAQAPAARWLICCRQTKGGLIGNSSGGTESRRTNNLPLQRIKRFLSLRGDMRWLFQFAV